MNAVTAAAVAAAQHPQTADLIRGVGAAMGPAYTANWWQEIITKRIGHHARPRRASATATLLTGVDTCKTGSGAGKRSGAISYPVRRRRSRAWTEDQASRRKRANTDGVGGWRLHTADDTPSRNAATRSKHCHYMFQGDIRPRAAAGSSRNGTT